MIRVIVAAVVLGALIFGLARTDGAAHTGYWRVADTAGNGLRLRTGPSGDYRIIEVMARGDRLKAFGHSGRWIKVRHLATGSVGWSFLAYVVADSGGTGSGGGSTSGLQSCWPTTFGEIACAPEWIKAAMWSAAQYYGASYWWLGAIASCESSFSPWAVNPYSGVIGLYQFRESTFYWISPGANIWNVYDQAYTAAHMYVMGLAWMWDCNWRI